MNRKEWQAWRQDWRRFQAWEEEAPVAHPEVEPRAVLTWWGQAWELAARFSPDWRVQPLEGPDEKIRHLMRVRTALSHLRGVAGDD